MKYIVYSRKSTDEKDRQILSIEAQIAELKELATRENLEIVEYIEESKTAKVPGREQFDKVLAKIGKGEAQGIISWHPDRLARNSIDGGKIIYLLDTGKLLDLKFPTFWFDNTPQGKFMLSIAFGQSKYYIDNLSENVKRGLRQKLRNGVYPGKAPWGYSNNEKLGSIEIDPIESKVIKKAFELFANGGKTFTDICRFLEGNELTDKNGRPLKLDRVKSILSNKFYIGIMYYSGEFYEGKHKLFITKELFNKVQKQYKLTERARPNNKHNLPYLGLMRCGECLASITGEVKSKFYKSTRGKVEYTYYRCTKKLGKCSQKYIQEPELEIQLKDILKRASLPQKWAAKWQEWLDRDEIIENQLKEENLLSKEQHLKSLDQKLNLLLDSYLDNVIDAEIYKTKKNQLFEEKLQMQEDIARIKSDGSSWLEPMRNFIEDALSCSKIARAKNTSEEIAFFAKTVGSDYFLEDRRILPDLKKGFDIIFSEFVPHANSANLASDSQSERDTGVEPVFPPWEGDVEPLN